MKLLESPMRQKLFNRTGHGPQESYLIRNLCVEKTITNFRHFFVLLEVHLSHFVILIAWYLKFRNVTWKFSGWWPSYWAGQGCFCKYHLKYKTLKWDTWQIFTQQIPGYLCLWHTEHSNNCEISALTTCQLIQNGNSFCSLRSKYFIIRRVRKIVKKRLLALSCLSIRLCAWNNSAPNGRISIKFDIWVFSENLLRKFKFH